MAKLAKKMNKHRLYQPTASFQDHNDWEERFKGLMFPEHV